MCEFCEGKPLALDDEFVFVDDDSFTMNAVFVRDVIENNFWRVNLSSAEELGAGPGSILSFDFYVLEGDDDTDASFVSLGMLVYFCPLCGRDLRPKQNNEWS